MIRILRRLWIKSQFRDTRESIYETLIAELSKDGARRSETISATFEAWAARDRARKLSVAAAHSSIAARMNINGMSFAESLADLVPLEEQLVIWAGEQTGNLVTGIEQALRVKTAMQKMKEHVREAILQPLLQLGGFVLTCVLFGSALWPKLLPAIPLVYFDDWAKPGIYLDLWLAKNWPLLAILFVATVLYLYALPRWTGRVRNFFDRFPPWSSYRNQTANIVLTTLAGFIANGMVITDACRAIRDRAPPYMRWQLNRIIPNIDKGEDALDAFYTGLFSREIVDRLQDARRTRDLDKTIVHVGYQSLSGLVRLVARQAAALNNIGRGFAALLMIYSMAIQLLAVQDATDRYTSAVSSGRFIKQ